MLKPKEEASNTMKKVNIMKYQDEYNFSNWHIFCIIFKRIFRKPVMSFEFHLKIKQKKIILKIKDFFN